ncbi:MAG: molybdopterin-dependent oxidoreductase [Chloroflexi bacterium]|nr:molybdopterin-dependent oxidoreductase [Chloroflexota bacterium]
MTSRLILYWPGAAAGLAAAVLFLATGFLLRLLVGVPTLPELAGEALIELTPKPIFSLILERLLFLAKPLMFVTLLVGMVVIGGLLGAGYARWIRRAERWGTGRTLLFGLGLWAVTQMLLLPAVGGGAAGALLPPAAGVPYALWSLVPFVVYALSFQRLYAWWGPPPADAVPPWPAASLPVEAGRRRLLGRLAVGGIGLVVAGAAWRFLPALFGGDGRGSPRSTGQPVPEITPNAQFYKVSKNFIDPVVAEADWRLSVSGLVDIPFTLSYEELLALPASEQIHTLECISNPLGGDLMSNAVWTGVPLRVLLERARLQAGAVDIVFHCADDYTDSIPLAKAMEAGTKAVWLMNGERLPDDHGFPLRILVPGIYGMKNAKWVQAIEAVDNDYKGFWERQGWSDQAIVYTTARIDVPPQDLSLPAGPLRLHGVAYSGDRGISRVEVSFDRTKTWVEAVLRAPLSPYSWVHWQLDWEPPGPGRHTIKARAFDLDGQPQEAEVRDPFPEGATGYHTISVTLT